MSVRFFDIPAPGVQAVAFNQIAPECLFCKGGRDSVTQCGHVLGIGDNWNTDGGVVCFDAVECFQQFVALDFDEAILCVAHGEQGLRQGVRMQYGAGIRPFSINLSMQQGFRGCGSAWIYCIAMTVYAHEVIGSQSAFVASTCSNQAAICIRPDGEITAGRRRQACGGQFCRTRNQAFKFSGGVKAGHE